MKACSYDFETAKKEYREFCKRETSLQVFIKDWYLDAVCDSPDDWRVILVKENGHIVAAFPFGYKKGKLFWYITNPQFVSRGGVYIDVGNRTSCYKIEKFFSKIIREIIQNLPYYDAFEIVFDSRFTNWQEFYRNGFSQTTMYSYVMDNLEGDISKQFASIRRSELRKAQQVYHVKKDLDVNHYMRFIETSYSKRNRSLAFSTSDFLKLANALLRNDAGEIRAAIDRDGNIAAVTFTLIDSMRYYHMFTSYDPDMSNGAVTLLIWDAMNDCNQQGKVFDFEGSMIPTVAKQNIEFNPRLEPYFILRKYSKRFQLKKSLADIVDILLYR